MVICSGLCKSTRSSGIDQDTMFILTLIKHPIEALVYLLALIVSVTVHEAAHAWTAYKRGDDTPYLMGRVTLNPAAHLDPVGSLMFIILGFGWGKPVLYNPMRLKHRADELMIALAGPISNIVLGIVVLVLAALLTHFGVGLINPMFLYVFALVNILLAAFNMIPIPPLDGSSIIAYFFPAYRSAVGSQIGFIFIIFLLIPIGGTNLLGLIMGPLTAGATQLVTLGGLLFLPGTIF